MAGGVSIYAAVSARVRVKYSELLNHSDMSMLGEATDLVSFVEALKRTSYGPMLDSIKEPQPTVSLVVLALKTRLMLEARSVIQATPGSARRVLIQYHRRHEVNNLKAVFRGMAATIAGEGHGSTWGRIRVLLSPAWGFVAVPAERMLEAGSLVGAIELLRGTPYYDVLVTAIRRYSAEQSLFPLEVALDLSYWRGLWQETRKLSGEDQAQAARIIGMLVDTNNLMWAIRYRIYKQLSEEELINYTLPFGLHVGDADIRAIAAGADMTQVIRRLYPDLLDVESMLDEPRSGLPRLELELKRKVADRCMAAFLGSPFHIGLPLAYLILHDLEIHDLVVLAESKSTGVPAEEFLAYMVRAGVPA